MKKFSQFISLNLISLSGYLLVAILAVIIYYLYPQAIQDSLKNGPVDNFEITVGTFYLILNVLKWFALIEIVLLILGILEAVLYKFGVFSAKILALIPEKFCKIHLILFFIGIILSQMPLVFLLYILLNP